VAKPWGLSKRYFILGALAVAILVAAGVLVWWQKSEPTQSQSSAVLNEVTPADVQTAFAQGGDQQTKQNPVAVIMPHHLVAKQLMAEIATVVGQQCPANIVVLGPDHENRGQTMVTTSATSWQSPWATYDVAADIVQALHAVPFVQTSESVIAQEHSALYPLPFLQHVCPKATFVQLIVRSGFDLKKNEQLAQALYTTLKPEDVVVASVDFSHYKTAAEARVEDQESLRLLEAGESAALAHIPADAPAVLAVAMRFAQLREASNFQLYKNTNAAEVANDPSQPSTTSYITGWWGRGR
jgi:AmmeMemoRadiSam system protein B